MDQPLNEREGFAIIEQMINRAKNNFSESGTLFLVWGFVILTCSLVHFCGAYFWNYENAHIVWSLTWLGTIFQVFYLRRKNKFKKVKSWSDDILKYLWIIFFVCIVLLIFILIWQKAYYSINPAILVMYGMPTFFTGLLLKFKPLIVGGVTCWLLALGCTFTPWYFQILYIGAAGITAWIIPGIYLRKKFLKENMIHGR
jgi:hypothetical protein